jgi:ADP-ribose pyrophosphatase
VEILSRERLHDGFYRFDRLQVRHERFDGTWTPPLVRELLVQRAAVAVLPFDPRREVVVLVEQFRAGCLDLPGEPWLLEAVAGLTDGDEAAEAVARRELAEETGLTAGRVIHACEYHSSPGGTSERVSVFIAEVMAPEAGGIFGLAHEHEDIRTHVLPLATALGWVDSGRIVAASGLVPLLWLRAHLETVRAAWPAAAAGEG